MARSYTVATAALALGTTVKWVDNILSHFAVSGVAQSRQGVSRRISAGAVFQLSVIRALSESVGVPVEIAVRGAEKLAAEGHWELGQGLSLNLDKQVVMPEIESRLEYAVEAAPLPRRGRPPGKAKRGA